MAFDISVFAPVTMNVPQGDNNLRTGREMIPPLVDSTDPSAAWLSAVRDLDKLAANRPTPSWSSLHGNSTETGSDPRAAIERASTSYGFTPTGLLSGGACPVEAPLTRLQGSQHSPIPSTEAISPLQSPSLQESSLASKYPPSLERLHQEASTGQSLPLWFRRLTSRSAQVPTQTQAQAKILPTSGRAVSPLTGLLSTHDRSPARNENAWAGSSLDREAPGSARLRCPYSGRQTNEVAGGNNISDFTGYVPPPMYYDAQAYPFLNDTLSTSPSSCAFSKEVPAQQRQSQQHAPEYEQGALQALEQGLQQLSEGLVISAASSADRHGANALGLSSFLPQPQANMSFAPTNIPSQPGIVPASLLLLLKQEQRESYADQLFSASLPDRARGGGKARRSRGVSHPQPRPYVSNEAISPKKGQRRLSTIKDSPEDDASRASTRSVKGVISKVTVPKAASAGIASDVSSGGGMLTRYVCPHLRCNKLFSTSSHARRHTHIHDVVPPYECPHDPCHATFTRRDNCTAHQLARHGSKLPAHRLSAYTATSPVASTR